VEESRHHEDERAPGLASCVGISPSTTFDGSISFSLAISSSRRKAREDDARCSVFKDRAPSGDSPPRTGARHRRRPAGRHERR